MVDVYFYRGPDGLGRLELGWDAPPPLCKADLLDYTKTILPAIIRRAQEYLEVVRPVLVVLA